VGLKAEHVKILACTDGWLRYQLPSHMRRDHRRPTSRANSRSRSARGASRQGKTKKSPVPFKGQKQKWFLLEMLCEEELIRFDQCDKPEFDGFEWVSYWYPVNKVIDFKRDVYRRALKQLATKLPVSGLTEHAASHDGG